MNFIPSGRQLPRTPPLTSVKEHLDFPDEDSEEDNEELQQKVEVPCVVHSSQAGGGIPEDFNAGAQLSVKEGKHSPPRIPSATALIAMLVGDEQRHLVQLKKHMACLGRQELDALGESERRLVMEQLRMKSVVAGERLKVASETLKVASEALKMASDRLRTASEKLTAAGEEVVVVVTDRVTTTTTKVAAKKVATERVTTEAAAAKSRKRKPNNPGVISPQAAAGAGEKAQIPAVGLRRSKRIANKT